MKFTGVGILWDAEKDKALCKFVDGEFETDDAYIISKLSGTPEPNNNDDEIIEAALRAKAKRAGIKSWHIKSIETLTAEIAEKEGV